jgi:hypothetical protein
LSPGESDPIREWNEAVIVTRHRHAIAASPVKRCTKPAPGVEHHVLFLDARNADRPRVVAPVAGIDHDHTTPWWTGWGVNL